MKYHMDHRHREVEWKDKGPSGQPSSSKNPDNISATKYNAICKRGPYAMIYSLCSKGKRSEMFVRTIPGWIQSKTMMKFNSDGAQRLHKSIFEMLVMDLMPFHTVSKPGFLRHQALSVPNFEVASDKYYRDMLDPTYDR